MRRSRMAAWACCPTASPRSATATARSSTAAPAPGRAAVIAPELVGAMNQMLAGVIAHGTGRSAALRASGRRQDRHDPGIPRRLVHRLHRRPRRRRLARQRRRHADEQGDRRHAAGRCSGAISCWRRPGHAGAAVAERPGAVRSDGEASALDRLLGWLTGAEAPPGGDVIPDRRRTTEALRPANHYQSGRAAPAAARSPARGRGRRGRAPSGPRCRRRCRSPSSRAASAGIERVAGLGEGGEAVGVEHLGPQIGVVAGRIAAAGEQVLEMRRAVAQADLRRHAELRARKSLSNASMSRARPIGPRVQVEIEQRAGRVFDRGKTLVEIARREQPLRAAPRAAARRSGNAGRSGADVSGTSSQCSKICDGNSTKSRRTAVPDCDG